MKKQPNNVLPDKRLDFILASAKTMTPQDIEKKLKKSRKFRSLTRARIWQILMENGIQPLRKNRIRK